MKRKLCIFGCVAALILIFIVFLLGHLGYSGQPETEYPFPESGTWVCKELGITLELDRGIAYVVDEEDTINCSYLRERGSNRVSIDCDEYENSRYPFAHTFLSGDFLRIDGDVFYMEEHKTGTVYTFCRREEPTR